jgi:hypothetical protein
LKGHGFDLESSHLKSFVKLSRLTFAVVLLYVWSISYGSYIAHTNQRRWVDRSDRGDLSIFQVGFRMIQRIIKKTWIYTYPFLSLFASQILNCPVASRIIFFKLHLARHTVDDGPRTVAQAFSPSDDGRWTIDRGARTPVARAFQPVKRSKPSTNGERINE